MSVKGKLVLADPDAAPATMSATMTLGEWKQVMAHLPTPGTGQGTLAAWQFRALISTLVDRATACFRDSQEGGRS